MRSASHQKISVNAKDAGKGEREKCDTLVVYHLLGKIGWSTVAVNGTRQIPNGNFPGDARFPFQDFLSEDRIKGDSSQKAWNQYVKTSKWNGHFPFGNSVWEFWSTFQEILFSQENFRSGRQKSSFHLHSIRNFRIFWVNGKQPLSLRPSHDT